MGNHVQGKAHMCFEEDCNDRCVETCAGKEANCEYDPQTMFNLQGKGGIPRTGRFYCAKHAAMTDEEAKAAQDADEPHPELGTKPVVQPRTRTRAEVLEIATKRRNTRSDPDTVLDEIEAKITAAAEEGWTHVQMKLPGTDIGAVRGALKSLGARGFGVKGALQSSEETPGVERISVTVQWFPLK